MTQLKGFKFLTTLVLVFKKIESEDKTRFDIFYSNSKVEVTINEGDIYDVFQSIYATIISNIQKSQAGLLIQSLITLLVFESIILSLEAVISNEKKRNHPRKGLINIPSIDDNECFKWC